MELDSNWWDWPVSMWLRKMRNVFIEPVVKNVIVLLKYHISVTNIYSNNNRTNDDNPMLLNVSIFFQSGIMRAHV